MKGKIGGLRRVNHVLLRKWLGISLLMRGGEGVTFHHLFCFLLFSSTYPSIITTTTTIIIIVIFIIIIIACLAHLLVLKAWRSLTADMGINVVICYGYQQTFH